MQGFIGLLMLAGLIAVLGKMVIGWMLTGLIVSLLLAALFALMAWPSRLERVERIFYAVCALVWLLQALLPQFAIAPRHALFLFLLATAASAAVFLVYSSPSRPWKAIAALAWAVLLAVPFGLLAWRDYRWAADLTPVKTWDSFAANPELEIAAPVLVVRTDLSREAWLERITGMARLPRISDIQGKLEGDARLAAATTPGQARSVILLGYDYGRVGGYIRTGHSMGSGGAYRNSCSIVLLDLKTRQRRELGSVSGEAPPSTSTTGWEYGAEPGDDEVLSAVLANRPSLNR